MPQERKKKKAKGEDTFVPRTFIRHLRRGHHLAQHWEDGGENGRVAELSLGADSGTEGMVILPLMGRCYLLP